MASQRVRHDWVFFGRTDAKAETPILWPPHVKSWLIVKDPDTGRDWGQGEKGMTEDEMAGWHHRLDRHEFGWTPGVGDGQGGLVCCDSWGRKESDMTEQLNWTELILVKSISKMQLNKWVIYNSIQKNNILRYEFNKRSTKLVLKLLHKTIAEKNEELYRWKDTPSL